VYKPSSAAPPRPEGEVLQLVALSDERVVGAVSCVLGYDGIHLLGLAVDPPFQRRGIARQVVTAVEDIARQRKLSRITLWTIRETGNVPVFERLGFRCVKERPALGARSIRDEALREVFMEREAAGMDWTRGVRPDVPREPNVR
jgi:GNAT superfamily N-acetyltransferase